jgi:hypothetical protein
MNNGKISDSQTYCPSAQPAMSGSKVFGIVSGTPEEPRVGYLNEPQLVTDEILALTEPVNPTEVFRFTAPCAKDLCKHFDGSKCKLVMRVIQSLPEVVDGLPPCKIRRVCLWWHQEGKAACMRCPQVVTEIYVPTDLQSKLAGVATE